MTWTHGAPRRNVAVVIIGLVLLLGFSSSFTATHQSHAAELRSTKKSFAYFTTFADSATVSTGDRRAQGVGDLTITTGPLSDTYQGARSGSATMVSRVVTPGRSVETRNTQVTIKVRGGTLTAAAMNEFPRGGPATILNIMPVVGGTGIYATARGTLSVQPIGNSGGARLAFDVFVSPMTERETLQVHGFDVSTAATDRRDGRGSIRRSTASSSAAQWTSISTRIGGKDATPEFAEDVHLNLPSGSVLLRGLTTRSNGRLTISRFAVLGGTGDYAGARGEAIAKPRGSDRVTVTLRLDPRSGKVQRQRWFDVDQRSFTVALPGGPMVTAATEVARRANGTGPLGTSIAARYTYDAGDDSSIRVITREINLAGGTIVVSGLATTNGPTTDLAIIGGTGNFGGAGGVLSSTEIDATSTRSAARFWR